VRNEGRSAIAGLDAISPGGRSRCQRFKYRETRERRWRHFSPDRLDDQTRADGGGWDGVDPSVPVLVMVGEKDDWTPAAKCQAVTGKTDFEVVVYPGDTHAFTMNFGKPLDFAGHHMEYDEKATQDAQQRAEAFIAAHIK
jgi:dienelactone hydrolase